MVTTCYEMILGYSKDFPYPSPILLKLPRNGTLTANCLLLAAGLLVGFSVGQWRASHRSVGPIVENKPGHTPPTSAPSHSEKSTRVHSPKEADAALALAGKQTDSQRLDTLRSFYGDWAQSDPASAAAHALQHLQPGQALSESLTAVAREWGNSDAHTAWQWAEEGVSGPLKLQLQTAILQGWSQRDPAAAAHWLSDSGLTTQPFYDAVASAWAAADYHAAFEWARGLGDPKTRTIAEIPIAREIVLNDPGNVPILNDIISPPAPTIASGPTKSPTTVVDPPAHPIPPEPTAESINMATAIADLWATKDPGAAAKWVDTLSPGPGRDEAAATLATVWAATDINAAVHWSSNISDPQMRRNVITHLGTTWGAIEPDKALAWLNTLPPEDAANGMEGALHSWAATDPPGLQNFVDTGGATLLTDTARLALGDVLTDTDIPRAMDLALGISNDQQRNNALIRFYHQWRKTDPDSATEWRNSQWATLPESTRGSLQIEEARSVKLR